MAGGPPAPSLGIGGIEVTGGPPAILRSACIGETCLLLGEGVVNLALLVCLACSRVGGGFTPATRDSMADPDAPFGFSNRSITFRTLDIWGTLPARLRLACRLVGWGCDVIAEAAAAAIGDAAAANSGVAGTETVCSAIIAGQRRFRGN